MEIAYKYPMNLLNQKPILVECLVYFPHLSNKWIGLNKLGTVKNLSNLQHWRVGWNFQFITYWAYPFKKEVSVHENQ